MSIKLEKNSYKKPQGFVLITVLMIFAAASIMIYSIQENQNFARQATAAMIEYDQAEAYLQAAEQLAIYALSQDLEEDKKQGKLMDHLSEGWNKAVAYPLDQGTLRGQIIDAQGRINLNDLDPSYAESAKVRQVLEKLFVELGIPENKEFVASSIIESIADWIDTDTVPIGANSAEDDFYSRLEMPYRTSNQKLVDLSELYLIRGLSENDVIKLAPYVVVWPKENGLDINVNSISLPVARAISQGEGESLVTNRPAETGYEVLPTDGGTKLLPLGVASKYFELRLEIEWGDVVIRQRTWLERSDKIKTPYGVQVIARDHSTLGYFPVVAKNSSSPDNLSNNSLSKNKP